MLKKKTKALDLAEVTDAWRIFPRLFLVSCFVAVVYLTAFLVNWYVHLPLPERTAEASGFAAFVLGGAMTFLKMVYSTYAEGGRDWTAQQPQVRTEESRVTSTTGVAP